VTTWYESNRRETPYTSSEVEIVTGYIDRKKMAENSLINRVGPLLVTAAMFGLLGTLAFSAQAQERTHNTMYERYKAIIPFLENKFKSETSTHSIPEQPTAKK
jgi:hypothetical protein